MIEQYIIVSASVMTSLLPPAVFVYIRQAIKRSRQEIVRDLAAVFTIPSSKDENVIPSFEFVKYKYYLRDSTNGGTPPPKDHSISSWIVGAIPLVLVLFVLSYATINFVGFIVIHRTIPGYVAINELYDWRNWPIWMWSMCASFAGGYVFMIRAFYRAVRNFDLSPLSFVGACNNLITGVIAAEILSHALLPISTMTASIANFHIGIVVSVIIVSFAVGSLPESATRSILRRSDIGHFKRENQDIYKSMFATPVEIIDGIDTEIRDRLSDYHIKSTQNLAAANPLMLFVETPFGVYQIMDWVAQAQLCCSVGPDALVKLWRLGIRTLFDLERIASPKDCIDGLFIHEIGKVLLPDLPRSSANFEVITKTVIANILVRLDDPHVHRLRQIYIKIGDRLGDANRRFHSTTSKSHSSNQHQEQQAK